MLRMVIVTIITCSLLSYVYADQTIKSIIRGCSSENTLVIIDPNSSISKHAGNYYKEKRNIPNANVLYMNARASSYDEFSSTLQSFFAFLNNPNSHLFDHINCIVIAPLNETYFPWISDPKKYISGINRYSISSAYILAYLRDEIIANLVDATLVYSSPNQYCGNPFISPVRDTPIPRHDDDFLKGITSDEDITLAFDSNIKWSVGYQENDAAFQIYPVDPTSQSRNFSPRKYFICALLGYAGPQGNSGEDIIAMIDRSVASDNTQPQGTFYFVDSNDELRDRSADGTGIPFGNVTTEMTHLGAISEVIDGNSLNYNLPVGRTDILGIVTGTSTVNFLDAHMNILPGAFVDHMTSYGATFDAGQTKITEWIKNGTSGSSGTVEEPFAIPQKFTNPRLHALYYAGLSLGESYLRSLTYNPYQNLLIGDPLTRPYAFLPEVHVNAPQGIVSNTVILSIIASTQKLNSIIAYHDLYIDGILTATLLDTNENNFSIDTTLLADGYHDISVVSYDNSAIRNQGKWHGELQTFNFGKTLSIIPQIVCGGLLTEYNFDIIATGGTVQQTQLFANGREIMSNAQNHFRFMGEYVGLGKISITSKAKFLDNTTAVSAPLFIDVLAVMEVKSVRKHNNIPIGIVLYQLYPQNKKQAVTESRMGGAKQIEIIFNQYVYPQIDIRLDDQNRLISTEYVNNKVVLTTDIQNVLEYIHVYANGQEIETIPLKVLVGDANADCSVSISDILLVKSLFIANTPVDGSTAQYDLNLSVTINNSDVLLAKANLGKTINCQ